MGLARDRTLREQLRKNLAPRRKRRIPLIGDKPTLVKAAFTATVRITPLSSHPTMKRVYLAATLCLLLLPASGKAQESPPQPLGSAYAITSLSDTLAGRQLSIELEATVTAAEPDWDGQFFVQDKTGGIWVEYYGSNAPQVGDRLAIQGQTHPGAFAPIIAKPHWTLLGTAPLPEAIPVAIDDLMLGVHDGLRIQIAGTVRTVTRQGDRWHAILAIGGHRLEVRAPIGTIDAPETLIGSTVLVRGTTATHYNQTLRHLVGVAVYAVQPEDFTVLAPEARDPFELPIIPMNRVAQYRKGMGSKHRIHVRGHVTHRGLGSMIFVQDKSAALRIMSHQIDGIEVGQEVDVAGFLEYENHLPFLNDSAFRIAKQTPESTDAPGLESLSPSRVPTQEIKQGLHHGEIITLTGKVLDRTSRPILSAAGHPIGNATTWLVQGDDLSFTVEHESLSSTELHAAPIGSTINATGVCYSELDAQVNLRSLQILIADPSSITIVQKPSWLTTTRLLVGFAILAPLLILAIAWSLTVSKKNARLKILVREKQEAQDLLQEANDTLEQKVEERSRQLQVEMSAREEARLQFRAVISERTRLARDLHDTLEQALTGIALQLETANTLFGTSREKAQHHVTLARRWLQQSQIELRHSIWDLRSRELEQFDLVHALKQSVERLADSMSLKMNFSTAGEKRHLSEILEENVLRIGQEAMTNIAKHAQATEFWLEINYSDTHLSLTLRDNGKGFQTPAPNLSRDNHYGLLGMEERANRINAQLSIESRPNEGTTVHLLAPIEYRSAQNHLEA